MEDESSSSDEEVREILIPYFNGPHISSRKRKNFIQRAPWSSSKLVGE